MTNQFHYYYAILLCLNIIIVDSFQPLLDHTVPRVLHGYRSFPFRVLPTTHLRSLKSEESGNTIQSEEKGRRELTQLKNRELLLSIVKGKGGKLAFPEEELPLHLAVKTRIPVLCENNHSFTTPISSIIYHDNWCPTCRNRGISSNNFLQPHLQQEELQKIANWFNGTFLGFVDQPVRKKSPLESRKPYRQTILFQDARWRCSEGHEFISTANNIRFNPSVEGRNDSVCSICRNQLGRTFIWNPVASRWDRGEDRPCNKITPKLLLFKEKLDQYVLEKKGRIDSNNSVEKLLEKGWESRIPLQCEKGHRWSAAVRSLLHPSKTWCKRCAVENLQMSRFLTKVKQLQLQFLNVIETEDNEKSSSTHRPLPLSLSLVNWSCSNGHVFNATLSSLTQDARLNNGVSCPTCLSSQRKRDVDGLVNLPQSSLPLLLSRVTMKSMKKDKKTERFESYRQRLLDHVNAHNGRLASPEVDLLFYQGCMTRIHLICDKNHTWEASLNNLLSQKSWCKICATRRLRRINMEKFHEVSRCFNGSFIRFDDDVRDYPNSRIVPALWRCEQGHVFSKRLYSITHYPKPERRKLPVCNECAKNRNIRVKWNSELVRWDSINKS